MSDYNLNDVQIDSPLREPSEQHVPISLILDVSKSMRENGKIDLLNSAVDTMIRNLNADERLKNIVDLAIFIFGERNRDVIYQHYKAIADCGSVRLTANDDSTYVARALDAAIEVTRTRCSTIYNKLGGHYKPWIVLITDAAFHDSDEELNVIGAKIKQREADGKLHFYGLGVDGFDRNQMEKFTIDKDYVCSAGAQDFAHFFSFIGRSIAIVSSAARDEADVYQQIEHNIVTGEPVAKRKRGS
jgi:uncharacterized protein YegL